MVYVGKLCQEPISLVLLVSGSLPSQPYPVQQVSEYGLASGVVIPGAASDGTCILMTCTDPIVEIEISDLTDAGLSALAKKTFVLITTVGPYGQHGEHVSLGVNNLFG